MASYSTIEPVSRSYWPGGNLAYGGTCIGTVPYPENYSSAYPTSNVLNYTPNVTSSFVWDPTKGTKRNWKKIKESGDISFTPIKKSRYTETNFLVSRTYDFATWKFHQQGCGATQTANRLGPLEGHTIYNRNSTVVEYVNNIDSSAWSSANSNFSGAVADAIITTQQAAFASATSTLDLLTNIAELGETLRFLQDTVGEGASRLHELFTTDENTYRRGRKLNAKQMLAQKSDILLQNLGKRWLSYRYAIMPIVYTIKDINSLMEERDQIYKSGRSKKTLNMEVIPTDYDLPTYGEKVVLVGQTSTFVRSLYKVRYDSGALQRLFSQMDFNLFQTAWELIPLSFVVDWFVSVNDAIIAATRIDSSTQSCGVTSVKTIQSKVVHLHDTSRYQSNFYIGAWLDKPAESRTFLHALSTHTSLQVITVESYDRQLFGRPSAMPKLNVDLNWKRILDGLALTYKPISKLLRSL